MPVLTTLSDAVLEGLTSTIKQCKEIQDMRIKREEAKKLLFLNKMIVPIEALFITITTTKRDK